MGIRFQWGLGLGLGVGVAIATALPAAAQERVDLQTIPEATEEIYYNYSGTFFRNRTVPRQHNFILGFGGRFAERELHWDVEALSRAVRVQMLVQNTIDPTLRVPDLVNPYSSSLLTTPAFSTGSLSGGSQFIFESSPLR